MPTYTYRCQDCSQEYDAYQSMMEDPHTDCPSCNGRVQRLIGAGAGILFKGSGFYVTDYKSHGKNDKKEKASTENTKTSGSGDAKTKSAATESKSATTKESQKSDSGNSSSSKTPPTSG